MVQSEVRSLRRRLKQVGFDWRFVRRFVLPEWWDDELADNPANRALLQSYLAKNLGFRMVDLADPSRPLFPQLAGVRFKRYRNEVDPSVRAATLIAQRSTIVVARLLGDQFQPFTGPKTAREVREAILRRHPFVNLESLLEFCWDSGIIVVHLAQVPSGGKRFDGMAAYVDGRPVIVLASRRDSPAWLAFHVAHELGHVMLGHVGPETAPLVDGELAGAAGNSADERAADGFGCEVLTGFAEPSIPDLKATAEKLSAIADSSGRRQGIDPGVYTLIYARSNQRWPVAQNALKHLRCESGGRALVAERLARHLASADPTEVDQRFLKVLEAA